MISTIVQFLSVLALVLATPSFTLQNAVQKQFGIGDPDLHVAIDDVKVPVELGVMSRFSGSSSNAPPVITLPYTGAPMRYSVRIFSIKFSRGWPTRSTSLSYMSPGTCQVKT